MTVPDSLPAGLIELLRERFGGPISSAQQMQGGLCNANWRLTTPSGPIVVRLGGASALRLGADRRSEAVAMVAAYPIAPELLLADLEVGWLVTEWIAGRHWSREEARETEHLQHIAALFARLHALPAPDGLRRLDMRGALLRLGAQLDEQARSCLAVLEKGAVLGLCHNDPHHQNILVGEASGLRLVDWEYAALGEVAVDLAEYANVHELGIREATALIEAYRAAGGEVSQQQFEAARYLCGLRNALWESAAAKKQS